jgi:hypothetical protein
MFRQIRFQTGETADIAAEMKKGCIPCMDVDDIDEFDLFVNQLSKHNIFRVEGMPYDKNARNRINEPEFEFRVPFYSQPVKAGDVKPEGLMYIDVYFEPDIERTYDTIGEL